MKKTVYVLLCITIYSYVYSSGNDLNFNVPTRMGFQYTDHNGLGDDYQMPIYGDSIVRNSEFINNPLIKIVQDRYPHLFNKKSDSSTAQIIPVLKFSPNSAFRKLKKSEIKQMQRYKK